MNREDSLFARIEDKDYTNLKNDFEKIVAKKVYNKVQDKKQDVIDTLNGVKKSEED